MNITTFIPTVKSQHHVMEIGGSNALNAQNSLQSKVRTSDSQSGGNMTNNEHVQRHQNTDMLYQPGRNNNETGKARRKMTVKICAKFNIVDPTIISWLYGLPHRLALEHLNKLVDGDELLTCIQTIRAPRGRVYVLNHNGAKYAEELLCMSVPFRKSVEPSRQVNQNNIMHDLMNTFICLRGLHECDRNGTHTPLWDGIVSESEFKRIYRASSVRNVDGLVRETDDAGTIAACEIEGSFKPKGTRQTILLKYLDSLKQGHYQKVFMFSQSQDILKDAKRFHDQLLEELTMSHDKKTRKPFISKEDAELLQRSIIYRTKFCNELQQMFYP
jgi:hypothetical protein